MSSIERGEHDLGAPLDLKMRKKRLLMSKKNLEVRQKAYDAHKGRGVTPQVIAYLNFLPFTPRPVIIDIISERR